MSKLSREHIALFVFVGLIATSLVGLLGYLAVGHSWNVAASNIDDAAGSMSDYTVIVFEGTVEPKAPKTPTTTPGQKKNPEAEEGSEHVADPDSTSSPDALEHSDTDPVSEAPAIDEKHAASEPEAPAAPEGVDASGEGGIANPSAGTDAASTSSSGSDDDPLSQDGSSQATPDGALPSAPSSIEAPKIPVDIDEVEDSYLEKNATVFALDTQNFDRYREGTILRKGDRRFGVFSADKNVTQLKVRQQIAYFQKHNVDFIVALTTNKLFVDSIEGLDIVICTRDEGLFVMGETQNRTFYVNTPEIGSVGVILISPSNVVTAKAVQE